MEWRAWAMAMATEWTAMGDGDGDGVEGDGDGSGVAPARRWRRRSLAVGNSALRRGDVCARVLKVSVALGKKTA
jgi:hypothetical protein